ncbi:CinA family protein [Skermania sp. ID1734]|uniref:CinA family protein n=1 Tax=Skermania sp. ID1734 TaxID=2597516 RepID=UPI00117D0213|nr:CinA family protein [Skermania sp. ID1734]TSD99515.1 CinA family protein [Skermania sp. ID1734]
MCSPVQLAEAIAELAGKTGRTVAVAESLTGGKIASYLAAAPSAGTWFRGAVVAYARDVKTSVLDVPDCPVVSETCARHMASNVGKLLGADMALGVTGEGGPEPQEDVPPGTVWFASSTPWGIFAELHDYDGDPGEIVDCAVVQGLRILIDKLKEDRDAQDDEERQG